MGAPSGRSPEPDPRAGGSLPGDRGLLANPARRPAGLRTRQTLQAREQDPPQVEHPNSDRKPTARQQGPGDLRGAVRARERGAGHGLCPHAAGPGPRDHASFGLQTALFALFLPGTRSGRPPHPEAHSGADRRAGRDRGHGRARCRDRRGTRGRDQDRRPQHAELRPPQRGGPGPDPGHPQAGHGEHHPGIPARDRIHLAGEPERDPLRTRDTVV